jgi:RNA polymerase sigma-70 factor (ECF subfamily)
MAEQRTPDVIARLVDSHRDFLRFLEKRVGDRELAEDILQDAFAKSVTAELPDDEGAVRWFYRVLRNAVVDHYRRAGAKNRAMDSLAKEMDGAAEPPHEVRGVICGCVSRLAANLQPGYAAAIQRVEVDGVPVQKFAEEAGITPNNAAVRLFRARAALRKELFASCGSCAEHGCLDCSCSRSSTRS